MLITAAQIGGVDVHVPGVLKVNAVGVDAVSRRRNRHVVNLDCDAVVELEVTLWTVLDRYTCDRHVEAPIESQCLSNPQSHKLIFKPHYVHQFAYNGKLTVGLILGIFVVNSMLI